MYFWYQTPGSKDWQIALASQRQSIIASHKPQFVTALDCDTDFTEDLSWEATAKVKYAATTHGVYFDFDAETPGDAIEHVRTFVGKLKEAGLNTHTVRFFLSGGKGFHLEIPLGAFRDKVPKTGIAGLPYIYKEIAYELSVPCLDFNVYSGRRGRMWRVPNIPRDDGKYKVPITEAELMVMTPEMYEAMVQAPRPTPPVEPAEYCPRLAVLFNIAEDKVQQNLKKRKDNKTAKRVLEQFKNQPPVSLQALMDGEGYAEGVSFQRIALQLSIAATNLGIKRDDFLKRCEGVCRKHTSDSTRYSDFPKRQRELARMYEYTEGNPCYEFSIGGLKSISTLAFDELETIGEYVPDPETPEGTIESDDQGINRGIRIHQGGFFVKTDDGFKRASDIGIAKPIQLIDNDSQNGDTIGYEVDVYVSGEFRGRKMIRTSDMQSKQRFQQWTGDQSASTQATDAQVSLLMDTLRKKTMGTNDRIYTLMREGLDLVTPHGMNVQDVVWSARSEVVSRLGYHYKLAPHIQTKGRSDLLSSPFLEDTPEARLTLTHLMNLNSPRNMAQCLGWMVACHHTALFRRFFNQFPILGLYGPSGSGKSTTVQILLWLHTFNTKIEVIGAGSTTQFAINAALANSASIPVVLDEYKPQEWDARRASFMREIQRNSYTGASMMSGRVNRDNNQLQTESYACVAPLIILAEALETETAVRERTVELALTKESRMGFDHEAAAEYLTAHPEQLCRMGHDIVNRAVHHLDLQLFRNRHLQNIKEIRQALGGTIFGRDRPIFNQAVCLTGFDIFRETVAMKLGDFGQERLAAARASLLSDTPDAMPIVQSEMSKTLGYMAEMSYGTGIDETTLYAGRDYIINGDNLELNLRFCYTKYRLHMGRLRLNPAYPTLASFEAALKPYGGVVTFNVTDSPIKMNSLTRVTCLSVSYLATDSIEAFKGGK